jgi:hypothetical protein
MINRLLVITIAGCALLGSVIVVELRSEDDGAFASAPLAPRLETDTPPRATGPRVDDLLATILARPLFSPTRHPAAHPDQSTGFDLGNVRLTGIVIEPGHHFAIFAVPDAKPIVRSEGEMINEWRLDSITPEEVVLSSSAGTASLQPKIDASLVRRSAVPARPPNPPQAAASNPQPVGVAARPGVPPPTAGSLKPPSTPTVNFLGTPMSPQRPSTTPRARQ